MARSGLRIIGECKLPASVDPGGSLSEGNPNFIAVGFWGKRGAKKVKAGQ